MELSVSPQKDRETNVYSWLCRHIYVGILSVLVTLKNNAETQLFCPLFFSKWVQGDRTWHQAPIFPQQSD